VLQLIQELMAAGHTKRSMVWWAVDWQINHGCQNHR